MTRHTTMTDTTNIRIGFIGLGYRAQTALKRYAFMEGVEIKAICDTSQAQAAAGKKILEDRGIAGFDIYSGSDTCWREVADRTDIDLLYISTPWKSHAAMAVYAMQHGKHAAVEVPAAMTVEECWLIVDTAERTGRSYTMLENCCYDPFTLNVLNMVRQGVFGEVNHAEGAYIHRLCERMIGRNPAYTDNWVTEYYTRHTGNIYPTHGLGPAAQAMNINRGDRMQFLVSMSSAPRSFGEYMDSTFGKGSPEASARFKLGDTNTSLIQTAAGKTIMLQHDISSPRPYSRANLISGTRGMAVKYPQEAVTVMPDHDKYITGDRLAQLLERYEHPLVSRCRPIFARIEDEELVRRGMMDYLMDYRLIYCLRHGLPTDIDVYDAAAWSCIAELSERSVTGGSIPVEIPDFTRGRWRSRSPLDFRM